ncbi:hypothetical protein NL676_014753 [Syzygium grande]|nr:hypothetical protein NL676_014753 [Syzygium grande]
MRGEERAGSEKKMGASGESINWFKTFFSCFFVPAEAACSRPEEPNVVEATMVESGKHFSSSHKVRFG